MSSLPILQSLRGSGSHRDCKFLKGNIQRLNYAFYTSFSFYVFWEVLGFFFYGRWGLARFSRPYLSESLLYYDMVSRMLLVPQGKELITMNS